MQLTGFAVRAAFVTLLAMKLTPAKGGNMPFQISTTAFAPGEKIPIEFTGDGPDRSPPLTWTNVPTGTKALALVVDDPDAPGGTFVHWVLYDLPGDTISLPAAVGKGASASKGSKEGKTSWGKPGYRGPSPPPGKPHRYFFRLYALSAPTGLAPGATAEQLQKAIVKTTLARCETMGLYGR
jgi:Raf kinase inhibitor-like YbhB/YbcL family protein